MAIRDRLWPCATRVSARPRSSASVRHHATAGIFALRSSRSTMRPSRCMGCLDGTPLIDLKPEHEAAADIGELVLPQSVPRGRRNQHGGRAIEIGEQTLQILDLRQIVADNVRISGMTG